MQNAHLTFSGRVTKIPFHGIGLSVDVYSPDLFELLEQLDCHGLSYGYLEIFKANRQALQKVRSSFPSTMLEYHADGLWVTQPDWKTAYPVEDELSEAARHLKTLGCSWINQECASKQMVGYSFGTYLPPLFSKLSAFVTAENANAVQRYLDTHAENSGTTPPLMLLETPPLTYFGFGDVSYQEYFRCVTERASCGLVLDIGHLWTVFRYDETWKYHSVEKFLEEFLQIFPLDRVVQIHVAGLHVHPSCSDSGQQASQTRPEWIDSHSDPIPPILFDMLEQILAQPGLCNLKGIALEVDTKPLDLILEEYHKFWDRFHWRESWLSQNADSSSETEHGEFSDEWCELLRPNDAQLLVRQYEWYVKTVTGRNSSTFGVLGGQTEGFARYLDNYVHGYLPHEILYWGGDLQELFPQAVDVLEKHGIPLRSFFDFWFEIPRSAVEPYDFFLIKIQRFVEFINEKLPSFEATVLREATDLLKGYEMANSIKP